MNCLDFQDLLQRYLDDRSRPPAPEYTRHLAVCAECRTAHQNAVRLLQGLRDLPRPAGSPELTERIIAGVLQYRRSRMVKLRIAVSMAAAAAVLLAIWAGSAWFDPSGPGSMTVVQEVEPMGPGSLAQSFEEARDAMVQLTGRLADESKEQTQLLLSATPALPLSALEVPSIEQRLDPAARSLRETGQGVTQGLQAVALSARQAVRFLFNDLSPIERDAKN
jgi:hypothetical protein